MSELEPKQNISVEIVSGVEGLCLLVNDYRVAGPKPWGGGTVTHTFTAKLTDIERAVYGNHLPQPENEPLTLDELRQMGGEPVWVIPINLHEWICDARDGKPEWGMARKSWVRIWRSETADLMHTDFDFEDYGKIWLAYRTKPERSEGE